MQMLGVSLGILCVLVAPATAWAAESDVPNLATRKAGIDWPCFLGPTQDNKSPERGIRRDWKSGPPPVVWQTEVGIGYSMPSVSRGRLFLFDAVGQQARLRCLHAETGRPLWEYQYAFEYEDLYGYDNGPRCFPIVYDDRVYLYGVEGSLHCLNVVDGAVMWRIDLNQEYGVVQNFFGVGSTPRIEGDLLIVQVGGSPAESQRVAPGQLDRVKANGAAVVALDKRTGKERYRLGDDLASYASPVTATIEGRPWCFVFARRGLLGFDPVAGTSDFHYPWRAKILESVNASSPVVVGDQVFISECYGVGSSLLKVRPGGYDVVWSDADHGRDKSLMTHWNTPIHHQGYIYASSGRHTGDAELCCIELATGKVQWRQPDLSRSSLLYVDGHFICLAESGKLYLIRVNPQRFELVGEATLIDKEANASVFGPEPLIQFPAWAPPILSHGLLYLRGRGRLVCVELIPDGGA